MSTAARTYSPPRDHMFPCSLSFSGFWSGFLPNIWAEDEEPASQDPPSTNVSVPHLSLFCSPALRRFYCSPVSSTSGPPRWKTWSRLTTSRASPPGPHDDARALTEPASSPGSAGTRKSPVATPPGVSPVTANPES